MLIIKDLLFVITWNRSCYYVFVRHDPESVPRRFQPESANATKIYSPIIPVMLARVMQRNALADKSVT